MLEAGVTRVLQTYVFGPHVVLVLEQVDDDGLSYLLLVDGRPVTDPLDTPPSFEDVVRGYAYSQSQDAERHDVVTPGGASAAGRRGTGAGRATA
jgi:hypothetical protein